MPMEIEFSLHSLLKLEILKAHGIEISKEFVENTIRSPDKIVTGYRGRLVAQKVINGDHVLRVVYEKKDGKVFVVTIYPGRRSRYEEDQV